LLLLFGVNLPSISENHHNIPLPRAFEGIGTKFDWLDRGGIGGYQDRLTNTEAVLQKFNFID